MTTPDIFEQAMEESRRALGLIANGDTSGYVALYSEREDATLANPFGPPARGREQILEALTRAAGNYRDGRTTEFERIATYVGAELAYTVEIERFEAKVGGADEMSPVALRVTCIYRLEDGRWRLQHRHADPITAVRPAESVIAR